MNETKQNKKLILFFSVLLSLILFTSCTTTPHGSTAPSQTKSQASAVGGLEFEFVRGAPPDKIYVQEGSNEMPFEVIVDIKNTGGYPKDELNSLNGRLFLTGFDKSVISGDWNGGNQFGVDGKLIGKTQSSPDGGFTQKTYLANSINFPFKSKEYNLMLMLTGCYYYETISTANVCIDPNPTSASQGPKICTMGNVRLEQQDGPVVVTNIEQAGNSREAIFTIEIANRGSGEVIRQYGPTDGVISEGSCMNLGFNDKDKLGITAEIIGLSGAECTPAGNRNDPIRLSNGVGKVICKFPLNAGHDATAYTTQLNLRLKYGYMQSITKQVSLVNTQRS